jgi:hypothetical protein
MIFQNFLQGVLKLWLNVELKVFEGRYIRDSLTRIEMPGSDINQKPWIRTHYSRH